MVGGRYASVSEGSELIERQGGVAVRVHVDEVSAEVKWPTRVERGGDEGSGGLCESVGYMAGVGAKVEDLREVAFDVLVLNISLESARDEPVEREEHPYV